MDKDECAKVLSEILPNGKQMLDDHYKDYDEMLIHVFVSEVIDEPFIDLIQDKTSNDCETELYKNAIKIMLLHGDEYILNALYVSVYERLCDEKEAFEIRGINIDLLIPEN